MRYDDASARLQEEEEVGARRSTYRTASRRSIRVRVRVRIRVRVRVRVS